MIVYKNNLGGFLDDVLNNSIADDINHAFIAHLGRRTSDNEKRSWENSMQYMYKVLNTDSIPKDAEVAIEYQIPLTAKRVDFIIAGTDSEDKSNVVIVELKQWDKISLTGKEDVVATRFQHGVSEVTHPSYQAWTYAEMLYNYNEDIRENNITLTPCAYLHNYADDGIISNEFFQECINKAPLFLKNDALKLRDFINKRINKPSKNGIIWMFENGRLKPSKQLADSLTSMLNGNQEFILLDEQKVVYETALRMALKSKEDEKKRVLIVEGGPGTGKSVVAINLLVKLTNCGIATQYVSKNSAPRDVYSTKLKGSFSMNYIKNLFVGSGCFVDCPENTMGALIVDEAHRLNEKSGMFSNLGENQIKEIINSAYISVFFIDNRQKIHIKDIGSTALIKQFAEEVNAEIYITKLESQFRCNGSDGYLSWIDNALQIRDTANIKLKSVDYDFRIFSDPNEMYKAVAEKNKINNKSRIVAGYCWDWNSKDDLSKFDIIIPEHNFKMQWNFRSNIPWLIDEESINQIGCIHTSQGLELDYVGVIVGLDLRYEGNEVITDVFKRSTNDASVKGFKSRLRENRVQALQDADEIIKNTYRTLMTRGMKGCYVYFCDKNLEEHFRSLVEIEEETVMEDSIRVESTVNSEVKFVDFLPFYTAKAACGYFGDGDNVEQEGWIKVEGMGKLNRNMYVVRAVGNSMEPLIKDGDYCVFRSNTMGSREGKVMLVQHHRIYDADYNASYTIKTYHSTKTLDEDGFWVHETIELQPKNKSYNTIIIRPHEVDEFRIIGEFIGVIKK